jgi:hypothetical protein
MLSDILRSLNKEDLEKLPRETQEKLLVLVRAELDRLKKQREGWMPPSAIQAMTAVVNDKLMRDIVNDNRRGVSEPGWLPPKAGGAVKRGTGWVDPGRLEPPPGVKHVDRIADHFAALDRLETLKKVADAVATVRIKAGEEMKIELRRMDNGTWVRLVEGYAVVPIEPTEEMGGDRGTWRKMIAKAIERGEAVVNVGLEKGK